MSAFGSPTAAAARGPAAGLSAWSSEQIARLVERRGADPQFKRMGKKIRHHDLDGSWFDNDLTAFMLGLATKEDIREDRLRELVTLFRKLRIDPLEEAASRKSVDEDDEGSGGGGGARGIRTGVIKQKTTFRGSFTKFFTVRIAVVMCSNGYTESDVFGNLKAAVNDGRAFEKMCVDTLGFAPENVHLVENPKKADFLRAFEWAAARLEAAQKARGAEGATPRAQFVFYYAGHGYLDAAGRGWIAPSGFKSDDLNGTGIAMSQCVAARALPSFCLFASPATTDATR